MNEGDSNSPVKLTSIMSSTIQEHTQADGTIMTPKEILQQAEDSLCAWNEAMEQVQVPADDLFYYAEELWVEDKAKWNEARRKALHGEWTVEQFDRELDALQQKQAPVWDIILKKEADLRGILEVPHQQMKVAHDRIKMALAEDPLSKKFMNPLAHLFGKPLHEDQQMLLHHYQCKLKRQFEDAEEEFNRLADYPSGLLTRVKLFRSNAIKETAELAGVVHKKKGVVHDMVKSAPVEA